MRLFFVASCMLIYAMLWYLIYVEYDMWHIYIYILWYLSFMNRVILVVYVWSVLIKHWILIVI